MDTNQTSDKTLGRLHGRRRFAAIGLAGLAASGLALIGQAGPATATAQQCEGGANGFVDIPDYLRGNLAKTGNNPASIGNGATVRLYYGSVQGAQRGWAMIDGATRPGDRFWMDWSTDGGRTITVQCGPFTVDTAGQTKTTAAKRTSSSASYKFRACGYSSWGYGCTGWW